MKFCDKLAKQRKNNNLSQEQLAEKLGVSRQAVSKWESDSSYPDMSKIIEMCNILNCTLEDLLDDGTIKGQENTKLNFNNYVQDFLKFITKTYNMFCSMTFIQKIKCIFELMVIFGILSILGFVIFEVTDSLTSHLFHSILSLQVYVLPILESIYIVILIIIGLLIFLHLFKIRYLDYYITIEDKTISHKTLEKEKLDHPESYSQPKREKVIIRDPKHSFLSFFSLLGKCILFMIKILIAFCSIPIVIGSLFLVFLITISLVHISYGILFLFLAILFLGALLLALLIIYFIYNFIFNRKQPLRIIFILFICSISLMGIGCGLTFTTSLTYQSYDFQKDGDIVVKTEYLPINENKKFYFYADYPVEYVIDNSLDNIKLDVSYPRNFYYKINHHLTLEDEYDSYYLDISPMDIRKIYQSIMKDLKQKRFPSNESSLVKVKITLSEKNYNQFIKQ